MEYVIKSIPYFNLERIADSGQAFRLHMIDDTHMELVAKGKYLQIADLGNNQYAFSCDENDFNSLWMDYFDLNRSYEDIVTTINPEDDYLIAAEQFGRGIRILKQDIWEITISYIISQRRSIPSIMTSVEKISKRWGNKIVMPILSEPFVHPLKDNYYEFPDSNTLANVSINDISETGVGYRAPYILSAANDFASGKLSEDYMNNLDDDTLFAVLMAMYGVGKKVANCIMLFGFARTGRFPIDVWIERIVNKYYNGHFDTTQYPDTAGIMQQFMFYYERRK